MNAVICALRSSRLVNTPLRSSLRLSVENQISIWFIHDEWVGVK